MATMTKPQFDYLQTLTGSRLVPAWVANFAKVAQVGVADMSEASRCIDAAKASPYKPRSLAVIPAVAVQETVPVGFYFLDGEVYKVKASKADKTRRYAYVFTTDGTNKGSYGYVKGAIYRLGLKDKLTLAQAASIGHKTGVCCCCGKELSDSRSVELGIGPVCIKKYM